MKFFYMESSDQALAHEVAYGIPWTMSPSYLPEIETAFHLQHAVWLRDPLSLMISAVYDDNEILFHLILPISRRIRTGNGQCPLPLAPGEHDCVR